MLSVAEWTDRREIYRQRVLPWVEDRRRRSSRHVRHPVYDFLFEYYSFPPTQLLRWSPGFGVPLETASSETLDWSSWFQVTGNGAAIPAKAFPTHRRSYLQWAVRYLEETARREPQFGCFGLHEWAMVYQAEEIRHAQVPLRLTPSETDAVVACSSLRCTHFDAYRFFTPAAVPRNRTVLCRETTTQYDQPGCVHVTMDLYRFAYKIAPFLASEVVADAFSLAIQARELDMRASPYNLREFGFDPIPIETRMGREEYVHLQRNLSEQATPIREQILMGYRQLVEAIAHEGVQATNHETSTIQI
ncbi:MAG: hypothetical protein LC104_08155 [Bacteroidales bacterium]|nr:hypothetical protein [Bacteroidales bacterium]